MAAAVSDLYRSLIDRLADTQDNNAKAALSGQPGPSWLRPDASNWNSLFDSAGIGKSFDRSDANQSFTDAISDAKSIGPTGDILISQLLVWELGGMERAFRLRHLSRVRALVYSASRLNGHGGSDGLLTTSRRKYLEDLQKVNDAKGKGTEPTSKIPFVD